MMADPELTGDLLLIGLWLARAVHLRQPAKKSFWQCTYDLFGPAHRRDTVQTADLYRMKKAIRDDAPRYDVWVDNPGAQLCGAPMVRRGGTCGRSATVWGFHTDPATGRRVGLGSCRRHAAWRAARTEENEAALKALGDRVPVPAANAGGVLARHLPEIHWPNVWRKLSPDWEPPAEGSPTRKPTLAVHVTDDTDFEPVGEIARPALVVHEGGWR
jgi:hypothetical protein